MLPVIPVDIHAPVWELLMSVVLLTSVVPLINILLVATGVVRVVVEVSELLVIALLLACVVLLIVVLFVPIVLLRVVALRSDLLV